MLDSTQACDQGVLNFKKGWDSRLHGSEQMESAMGSLYSARNGTDTTAFGAVIGDTDGSMHVATTRCDVNGVGMLHNIMQASVSQDAREWGHE